MIKYILLILIVSIFLTSCDSNKSKAKEHFKKANQYFKKKDLGNAATEIESAINFDNTNYDYSILNAKIKKESTNYEAAIHILENLVSKNYKLDTVNFLIGKVYFEYGSDNHQLNNDSVANELYNESIKFFNATINNNIKYFSAHTNKQRALHNINKYGKALATLNNAIKIFPDSMSLISSRGVEKNFLGDIKGAINDLTMSIESEKLDSVSLAEAYRFRGLIFLDIENLDKALIDLSTSIKYDANDEYVYFNRAETYRKMGLKDKACEDYRKSADLGYIRIYETIKVYCED